MEMSEKRVLREALEVDFKGSGLSGNEFARRLGVSPAMLSRFWTEWDAERVVGERTWGLIANYLGAKSGYRIVFTDNIKKVWDTCERAHAVKMAMPVCGAGGFGKTTGLVSFKEKCERERGIRVYYFDASQVNTRREFVSELARVLGCYEKSTRRVLIEGIRGALGREDCLLLIDEVSSLKGEKVTVIKDVMSALRGVCGVVLAGTPYFFKNLNAGVCRDGHLYSETRDRLFLLPTYLSAPTEGEAALIFEANGIVRGSEAMRMLLGEYKEERFRCFDWKNKRTFRGISDCLTAVRVATMGIDHGVRTGDVL